MFRTIRAFVIAVLVAASLLGSATVASADPGTHKANAHSGAQPVNAPVGITWE
jgi:hypothetical protein